MLKTELLRRIAKEQADYQRQLEIFREYSGQYLIAEGKVRSLFLKSSVFFSMLHWVRGGSWVDLRDKVRPSGAVLASHGPPTLGNPNVPDWRVTCNHLAPRIVLDDVMRDERLAGIIRYVNVSGRYSPVPPTSRQELTVLLEDNCYIPGFNPVEQFERRRQQLMRQYGVTKEDEERRQKELRLKRCRREFGDQVVQLYVDVLLRAMPSEIRASGMPDDVLIEMQVVETEMAQQCERSFRSESYDPPKEDGERAGIRERAEEWANGTAEDGTEEGRLRRLCRQEEFEEHIDRLYREAEAAKYKTFPPKDEIAREFRRVISDVQRRCNTKYPPTNTTAVKTADEEAEIWAEQLEELTEDGHRKRLCRREYEIQIDQLYFAEDVPDVPKEEIRKEFQRLLSEMQQRCEGNR